MPSYTTTKETSSPKRRGIRVTRLLLWILAGCLAFLTIIPYLPVPWLWFLEIYAGIHFFRLMLLLGALCALLAALTLRSRMSVGFYSAISVVLLIEAVRLFPMHTPDVPNTGNTLTALTWNMGRNWNAKLLADQTQGVPIDVLALQEVVAHKSNNVFELWTYKRLTDLGYEHAWCWEKDAPWEYRLWTLVRGTILYSTLITFTEGEYQRNALLTTAVVRGDTLHILNVHLEMVTHPSASFYQHTVRRLQQAEQIATVLDTLQDYPVIVAGDMNSTPTHRSLRPVRKRLTDTWLEAGYGFGHTWRKNFPFVRIDCIYQRGFRTLYATPFHFGFSDHFPYYAILEKY